MREDAAMKTKEVLTVVVFAVSLLVLMIGVMFGSRASAPLAVGAVPAAAGISGSPALGLASFDRFPPGPAQAPLSASWRQEITHHRAHRDGVIGLGSRSAAEEEVAALQTRFDGAPTVWPQTRAKESSH